MAEHNNESVVADEEFEAATKDEEVIDLADEIVVEDVKEEETSDSNPLQGEVEKLQKEKNELNERMLRIQAEFDNFKKRTQRERAAERKYKSQDLINELLPAIDNFERALAVEVTEETKSIIEGITMVYNQIQSALESEEVEVIKTVGQEFDPNLHHAVMQVEDDNFEENIVTEELQKGYMMKDRVIRAAMVKVNK